MSNYVRSEISDATAPPNMHVSTTVVSHEHTILSVLAESASSEISVGSYYSIDVAHVEWRATLGIQAMIMPQEIKWHENMSPGHKFRIYTTFMLMFVAVVDLLAGVGGLPSLFHWSHDILLAWGAFSVFMTAILLAKRYK